MEIKDLIREVVVEMIDDKKIESIIAEEVRERFDLRKNAAESTSKKRSKNR